MTSSCCLNFCIDMLQLFWNLSSDESIWLFLPFDTWPEQNVCHFADNNQVTPGNRGTFCFWSISTISAAAVSAAAVLQTLFNFRGKHLKLISLNHTCSTYGCGKIFCYPSRWPWVKVTELLKWNTIYLVPYPIITKLGRYIFLANSIIKFSIRFSQSNILFAIS